MNAALRASLVLLFGILAVQAQVSVTVPANAGSCSSIPLSWQGGTAPYQLQLVPGSHDHAAPMRVLATSISSTSYQWTVDVKSGTNVALIIKDSTGSQGATGAFSIGSSSSNCSPSSNSGGSTTASGQSSTSVTSTFSTSSRSGDKSSFATTATDSATSTTSAADTNQNSATTTNSHSVVGPVVGAIAAVIVVAIAAFLFYCFRRRRQAVKISETRSFSSAEITPASPSFIQPFRSPVSPSLTAQSSSSPDSRPWSGRPSKYGFSNARSRPHRTTLPPPPSTPSSDGGGLQLTREQTDLVQQLVTLQVPSQAVSQVIDRLVQRPAGSSSSTSGLSNDDSYHHPPAYDFKQPIPSS